MSKNLLKTLALTAILLSSGIMVNAQKTPYELDPNKNTTVTYEEMTDYYASLLKGRKDVKLIDVGATDVGKPLQLIVLSKDGDFDPVSIKSKGKAVMLINNGIHPGEPEGIDASMMFIRELLKGNQLPDNLVLCVIPVYNIAGMLNRGESRVNQNGPNEYGFRGSRQHYDLNRDFIKGDTRNSRLFQKIFSTWDPDVFFDTHTSNGADYQYVMTLIETHKDKLHPELASFMKSRFTDELYRRMDKAGFPMVPYVNPKGETPESGLVSFLESPRYSTGYAALHNTIGYMPETHMWKPYKQRVESTYTLMKILYEVAVQESKELVALRLKIKESVANQVEFPVSWKLDTEHVDTIDFMGFESGKKKSDVSGQERLYYDRSKPFNKQVPYYSHYKPSVIITKPKAYIIPQAYDKLVELMQINGVQMKQLEKDELMEVEMYYISSYKTQSHPYEGHYPHHSVEVSPKMMKVQFYAGDWVVETDQPMNRYIVETLEPQGMDSFFSWNFFDAILSQKEYFSAYIFEDTAADLLRKDPKLKQEFEDAKNNDPIFAADGRAQLEWIYKRTHHYEHDYGLYPIARAR
jgi:hypothetical protein